MKISSRLIGIIALFLGLWQLYAIIAKWMTQTITISLMTSSVMLCAAAIIFMTHGILFLKETYQEKWSISDYFREGMSGDWIPASYKTIMVVSFSIFLFASILYFITIFKQLIP